MKAIFVASLLLGATVTQVTSKFTSGCKKWMVYNSDLITECKTSDPDIRDTVFTSLDLNTCIGVHKTLNAMVWMYKGDAFTARCGNCSMLNSSEPVIQCDCINPKTGGMTRSSVNLNDDIYLLPNGSLVCGLYK